jgi:hypothetical protein
LRTAGASSTERVRKRRREAFLITMDPLTGPRALGSGASHFIPCRSRSCAELRHFVSLSIAAKRESRHNGSSTVCRYAERGSALHQQPERHDRRRVGPRIQRTVDGSASTIGTPQNDPLHPDQPQGSRSSMEQPAAGWMVLTVRICRADHPKEQQFERRAFPPQAQA